MERRQSQYLWFALAALAALFLVAACSGGSKSNATPAATPTRDAASDAKATAGAMRPATPTPVASDHNPCPKEVDPGACQAARLLTNQPATLPLAAITATCPSQANWLLAMEPVCDETKLGQTVSGFASDAKVFHFVDEATFRASQADWLPQGATIAGIACPRPSDTAPLDCSGAFEVLLTSPTANPVAVYFWHATNGPVIFGANYRLMPDAVRGGWMDTAHAGLEDYLPAHMWLIPWQPLP